MHVGVLVRVDNCDSFNEAERIANDFGYRHSAEGVHRYSYFKFSPEKFLKIMSELHVDLDYDAEELRLLLECGTDIKDLAEKNLLEVFSNGLLRFNVEDNTFNDAFKADILSEAIVSLIHKDQEIRRIYYNNTPDEILISYDSIKYVEGLIVIKISIFCGYEDWDYSVSEMSWGDSKSSAGKDILDNYDESDFCGYAIAETDDLVFETYTKCAVPAPEGFFDNITDKTYYMILNVHI